MTPSISTNNVPAKDVPVQLFFLYDSHCPWSYVTTRLVNKINVAFPNITLHLWHTAFFDGTSTITDKELNEVEKLADMRFSQKYRNTLKQNKNATLAANIMTWALHKTPKLALPLLNALQQAHFEQANNLTTKADLDEIIKSLKLSPPAKIFNNEKLSKDTLAQIEEIFALQDIINTQAIPALLLAIDDQLILLNHNFYLAQTDAIVEAVQLELTKYQQQS